MLEVVPANTGLFKLAINDFMYKKLVQKEDRKLVSSGYQVLCRETTLIGVINTVGDA
jgi:hypothetical protein